LNILLKFIFNIFSGVPSLVQAVEGFQASVPKGALVYAVDPSSQMPGSLRYGESHKGGQPIVGAQREVSVENCNFETRIKRISSADWWFHKINERCTLCSRIISWIRPNGSECPPMNIFR
jgi:hypothetical protein